MTQTTIIESPPNLSAYFSLPGSANVAWLAWDGPVIVGWQPTLRKARNAYKGLRIEKLYKSIERG